MKLTFYTALLCVFIISAGCSEPERAAEQSNPRTTVRELLKAHGLWQKLPEDRNQDEINQSVPRETLGLFFTDLERFDPFTGNLYVGFIVGALARSQERLHVRTDGRRGTVHAGNVKVALVQGAERWQISIDASIPEEIRQRAREEQRKLAGSPSAAQELHSIGE